MSHADSHIADQQLLSELDGELSGAKAKEVRMHLSECWRCRSRQQELESTISGFIRSYQGMWDPKLPSATGPRALLKARLAELTAGEVSETPRWLSFRSVFGWVPAAVVFTLAVLAWLGVQSKMARRTHVPPQTLIVSVPNSRLTPGAAVLFGQRAVCSQANVKNKAVPVALQRAVFAAYGITGTRMGDYEVDYLITPALGGADDIRNLWPQSHTDTVWNAEVKDALEDRLREMVCDGRLELEEAQREISVNWIEAYKKYFHTDRPVSEPDNGIR